MTHEIATVPYHAGSSLVDQITLSTALHVLITSTPVTGSGHSGLVFVIEVGMCRSRLLLNVFHKPLAIPNTASIANGCKKVVQFEETKLMHIHIKCVAPTDRPD